MTEVARLDAVRRDDRAISPPSPSLSNLSIGVMGTFRVRAHGRTLIVPASVARILAFLALAESSTRLDIVASLWPDLPRRRGLADLRTLLWRVQKVERDLIHVAHDHISLAEGVGVDMREVEKWIAYSIAPTAALDERTSPPASAGRVLLPGWDEPWLDLPRERLRLLQNQAFESVAGRLLANGRPGEALPLVLTVVQGSPLRESANQLMIEIHLRQGNVAEAFDHFERYRATLHDELGVEPGMALMSLMARFSPTTLSRQQRRD